MQTREFFESIFGAGEGYAVLTTDLSSKGTFFSYPVQLDDMVRYADTNGVNQQVYFSPVLFSQPKREKIYAKTTSVAYADSDVFDFNAYKIVPSLTVQTAEGRTHNYWFLDGDYNPHTIALLNRRVHWAHKDEGLDRNFGHAAKMLRVPGSLNTNRDNFRVTVVVDGTAIYSLAELEAAYPATDVPEKVYGTDKPLDTAKLPDRATLLDKISDDRTLRNLLFDEPIPGRRSEMRYKLESELFRYGFSAEEVLVLVWDAPCCKYKQENRPQEHLWKEILNAEVDPENQPPVDDGRPVDLAAQAASSLDGDALINIYETIIPADFLTAEERASLPVTFIDKYEAWATSHTTSPAKYHRMAALMLMSCVYAEYGHIPFDFEETNLAVWVMLLGNTTVDRKTTALKYMTGILESLETPDYTYDIGSDVTQQGLNKALSERPHQSSLLHADEVQDVFREVFSQGYLTGLVGYWTQLYSGKSRGTLRSTGDKQVIKSVPVNFQMYLTGIVTHVAEALTIKHFESGFLTRFLYTLVEPRPYEPQNDPLKQSGATTAGYVDPVRESLVQHLAVVRNFWGMRGNRSQTTPIRFSDPALARLNEFSFAVKKMIMTSSRFETLKGPIERLVISVAKTAALFAMDDKRQNIELDDVLSAIDLAEDWYDDLQKIAAMISESAWQADLTKLEKFILQKGGKVSYELAYKQFDDKRPKEFLELADGLEDMGRIIQRKTGPVARTLEINFAGTTE